MKQISKECGLVVRMYNGEASRAKGTHREPKKVREWTVLLAKIKIVVEDLRVDPDEVNAFMNRFARKITDENEKILNSELHRLSNLRKTLYDTYHSLSQRSRSLSKVRYILLHEDDYSGPHFTSVLLESLETYTKSTADAIYLMFSLREFSVRDPATSFTGSYIAFFERVQKEARLLSSEPKIQDTVKNITGNPLLRDVTVPCTAAVKTAEKLLREFNEGVAKDALEAEKAENTLKSINPLIVTAQKYVRGYSARKHCLRLLQHPRTVKFVSHAPTPSPKGKDHIPSLPSPRLLRRVSFTDKSIGTGEEYFAIPSCRQSNPNRLPITKHSVEQLHTMRSRTRRRHTITRPCLALHGRCNPLCMTKTILNLKTLHFAIQLLSGPIDTSFTNTTNVPLLSDVPETPSRRQSRPSKIEVKPRRPEMTQLQKRLQTAVLEAEQPKTEKCHPIEIVKRHYRSATTGSRFKKECFDALLLPPPFNVGLNRIPSTIVAGIVVLVLSATLKKTRHRWNSKIRVNSIISAGTGTHSRQSASALSGFVFGNKEHFGTQQKAQRGISVSHFIALGKLTVKHRPTRGLPLTQPAWKHNNQRCGNEMVWRFENGLLNRAKSMPCNALSTRRLSRALGRLHRNRSREGSLDEFPVETADKPKLQKVSKWRPIFCGVIKESRVRRFRTQSTLRLSKETLRLYQMYRCYEVSERTMLREAAAVILQNMWKRRVALKVLARLREQEEAVHRVLMQRKLDSEMNHAVIRIQKWWKHILATDDFRYLQETAAVFIQQWWHHLRKISRPFAERFFWPLMDPARHRYLVLLHDVKRLSFYTSRTTRPGLAALLTSSPLLQNLSLTQILLASRAS